VTAKVLTTAIWMWCIMSTDVESGDSMDGFFLFGVVWLRRC
jgi:hypothetical protein